MVSSTQGEEENGQHNAQSEVRDMISKITHRLTGLGKSRARQEGNNKGADDDDNGVSIITLAGDNKGATMKGNMDELTDTHGGLHNDENGMVAYTNSNYQAVNNSIVFEGECEAEDPGVHIVISDYLDDDEDHDHEKHEKKKKDKKDKKKKKKKNKESSDEENQDEKSKDSE